MVFKKKCESKKVKLAVVVFAVITAFGFILWLPPVRFSLMNELYTGHRGPVTNFLVKSLGKNRWGLRLAANDMTGTGGSNLGLSFRVLMFSDDIEGLVEILGPIASNPPEDRNSKSIGRCFRANVLLLEKAGRDECLGRIVDLLSDGGPRETSIQNYRRSLTSYINDGELNDLLMIDGELDLPVISEKMLKEALGSRARKGDGAAL